MSDTKFMFLMVALMFSCGIICATFLAVNGNWVFAALVVLVVCSISVKTGKS